MPYIGERREAVMRFPKGTQVLFPALQQEQQVVVARRKTQQLPLAFGGFRILYASDESSKNTEYYHWLGQNPSAAYEEGKRQGIANGMSPEDLAIHFENTALTREALERYKQERENK